MPVIDIGALFIGREDWEGDDGSGVATEDDDDTDTDAGGYVRLGRAFREEEDNNEDNGDEQGRRARRRCHNAVEVRDALRGGAVDIVVHGSPEATIIGDDRGEGKRGGSFADETITDGAKTMATTERGMHIDDNDYERPPYIQRQDDAHNIITFNRKHIICLIFCN
jgi:hypothetical protein